MINKILFSPIGGSDPVNAGHDAAWIHCCRHFQPDLTVTYFSAQMLPRETEKHIFSRTLEKLCKMIGKDILFEMEERPDLGNPQDFEVFYGDFESVLTKYHKKYPDAEILINVSSGTPAMKSCLIHLYHMLPFPVKLIQVYGPHDEMGMERGNRATVSSDHDVDEAWENNLDNLDDADNRCHILKDQQQAMRLKVMQLKTLISHHEYSAALTLAEGLDLKDCLPERLITVLKSAKYRVQMDLHQAGLLLNGFVFDDGRIMRAHYRELPYQGAEMFLTMGIDLKRDDIASCLRKLTPVLFALIVDCIGKHNLDISSIMDGTQKYLDRIRFQNLYPVQYGVLCSQIFNNAEHPDTAPLDSGRLMIILKYMVNASDPVRMNIEYLRNLEKEIRNEIAHKPVKMTENDFQSKAGCATADMMEKIRQTFELLDPVLFNKDFWISYDRMNSLILDTVSITEQHK